MSEQKSGTETSDLGESYERETDECPVCNGTVRKMRNDDRWLCDGCARYWDEEDLDRDTEADKSPGGAHE